MADIREVVQQMIDAGEPENKIKAVVKAYKEKQASAKEVETQVDATVTEDNTASTSDDGSSESQAQDDALNVLGTQGNYSKVLDDAQVTDVDQTNISNTRTEQADKLEQIRVALDLPEDFTEKQVADAYQSVLDKDDLISQSDYRAPQEHLDVTKKLQDVGAWGELGYEGSSFYKEYDKSIKDDVALRNSAKDGYFQNESLSAYMASKDVSLAGLTQKEKENKSAEVLNSAEYKEFASTYSLSEEQIQKQNEQVNSSFIETKSDELLEDRIFKDINDSIDEETGSDWGGAQFLFDYFETGKNLYGGETDRQRKRGELEEEAKEDYDKLNKYIRESTTEVVAIEKNMVANYERLTNLMADIDKQEGKEFTTQQQVDEYNEKVKQYNDIHASVKVSEARYNKVLNNIEPLSEEVGELETYLKAVTRDPNFITALYGQTANATIDLAQGVSGVFDMIYQLPSELSKELKDPVAKGFATTKAPRTTSLGKLNKKIDNWQEENITSQIRKPVAFDDIENAYDAVEFGANLFAGQAPQLAMMTVTGGASLYVMGASATGSKFYEMNEQKDLFYKTGGLYGQDHNFSTMALNSSFSGTVEALSERITLGSISKTKRILGGITKQTTAKGYGSYLIKNVFTRKNIGNTLKETTGEGLSEVAATMGSNFADILSGDKEKNIYDGTLESFVSGKVISSGIQSPRLFAAMSAPFKSEQTNITTSVIANRLNAISSEMVKLPEAFEGAELDAKRKELEDEYASLVVEANNTIEQDIKRVDVLEDSEKAELINIERANQKIRSKAQKINSSDNLTPEQKAAEIDKLQKQYSEGSKKKQSILDKYPQNVVDAKYKQEVEAIKAYEKQVKERGVVDIDVVDRTQQEFEDLVAQGIVGNPFKSKAELEDFTMEAGGTAIGYQEILDNPNSTEAEKQEAAEILERESNQTVQGVKMLDFITGNGGSYGAFAPRIDEKGNLVGLQINLNKTKALTDNELNVASHEFVHAAFYNTLKADPIAQERMGGVIDNIIDTGGIEFLPGQKEAFDKKINLYEGNVKGEEKLAFLTEFVRGNKATIKESGFAKIKGMFRRFTQNYMGKDITLNTNQDVLNFIKDYDVSVKNNKPNKAIIRMLEKGANGKIFKDARTPQERADQAMYSKALDASLESDPDLKQTFDKYTQNKDGSPKHKSQEDFEANPDYYGAYLEIVEGRALDGLIQQGMTRKGLPPEALRKFTRDVKEKIGRRYLPKRIEDKDGNPILDNNGQEQFKPGYRVSNDSLFGWLTGVAGGRGKSIVYRAKGDVMNQYKADQKANTVSLDAPIGDAGSIADLIPADSSALDFLEDQDLSVGRKEAVQEMVNELIAKDELKLSQDAKDAISDIVSEANIPLDGLTYKGFKKLMVESMKVDKNGELKPPTKESDVVPIGALYNVLEITSAEFGVSPARVLANQDLDADQREAAQEKILDLSINQDGSFNDILFQLLPEGETRSGEATGVANTKLGDFYTTGDRVKVSEGASKALGQKQEQKKKTIVTKKEFLDKFGINEDGTFRTGTSADGAIRALVVQMAQLAANQEVRLNAIGNGTTTEAIAAKLGDGKSELVFSKADPAQDVVAESWPELVMEAAGSRSDVEIQIAVDSVYGDSLGTRQRKSVVNQITKDINKFVETNEKFKGKLEQTDLQTETDFVLNQWKDRQWQQGINYALKGLPNIPDGFKAGNVATDIEGATKARGNLKVAARSIMDKFGVAEGLRLTIAHLQSAYAGAGKIGTGALTVDKPGGNVIVNQNPTRGPENRVQVVESKEDFDALIKQALPPGYSFEKTGKSTYTITSPDGSKQNIETALHGEDSASFLKDKDYEGRKKTSQEARDLVELLTTEAYNRVQSNDSFNEQDFGFLIMTLGSSMKAPIRRAANAEYIQDGVEELFAKNPKTINQLTQYEHMNSKELVSTEIILGFKNNGKFDKNVFDGYHVQVITKEHDTLINKAGLMTKSTPDGSPRAYSLGVLEQIIDDPSKLQFVKPMRSLDPAKQGNDVMLDVSTNFVKIAEALAGGNIPTAKQMSLLGAATSRLAFSKAPNPRGMSAFDFDETLIIDGDNFIIATDPVTGKETRISSGNWPLKGPELMQQGYDFNFDDFINVRGGVEGPLFQKFKNRITKYGPENNYILTARPMEAAVAIHGWLKSKGINIPLENITGLGNSTGAAKAQWMLGKFAEGYNDMYFVDDALPNVEAVANVIDQLDVKGKSVQAKLNFSKENPKPIDDMLERNKGVSADETFNRVKARNKGKQNRKRQLFIPPSADDFEGLMYYNYGKGEQGNADAKFFKENFYDPFNRADRQLDMYKQKLREDAKKVSKALPAISKSLTNEFENSGYTNEQAMRIYLYDKNGYSVPGISEADQKGIAGQVAKNRDMVLFAGAIEAAVGVEGYLKPQVGWNGSSFNGDMSDAAKIKRSEYIAEWQENVDNYFTEDMLNKLEAVHGSAYRSALEDTLARMKSGTNRPTIRNKTVNAFLDWLNGSVGAIMFFNARSAVLQTLSTVNFINFEDNNIFAAAKAFGNQKQYWKDFSMLFNSPMLKQRRGGLQSDLNASELQRLAEKGGVRAVVGRLLELGFAPTQIADSFAISAGGSTFYRNRVSKYTEQGLNQKQAEEQAFIDFQEIAEATQQSSRPDKISQEQASVLGRLILAFQNTPMQYNRLIKKAALDLINGRGNTKANISRIIYYGAVQNIIFSSLQSALFAVAFDDEEDEEFLDKKLDRIANGTLDSLLRGSGIYGAVLSTVKNTIMKYMSEREKGMQADNGKVLVEALNVSPPLGSKVRKLYSAMTTDKWNKDVYDKIPLSNVDNPIWDITGNLVEASFNVPLARIQRKLSNLKAAMDNDNANWQRLALFAGWDKWGLGIDRPEEIEEARQEVKEENRQAKNQERKAREAEVKQEQEEKYLEDQKEEKEEDKKPRCAAATKSGGRCKGTPVDGTHCTIHTRVEQRTDGKDVQCKKIKSDGKRCGMQTSNKSGLCYYHD